MKSDKQVDEAWLEFQDVVVDEAQIGHLFLDVEAAAKPAAIVQTFLDDLEPVFHRSVHRALTPA